VKEVFHYEDLLQEAKRRRVATTQIEDEDDLDEIEDLSLN
jgi:hypothetical protein